MQSRTLVTQLRLGNSFSLFGKNFRKPILPSNGIRYSRFIHQNCKETLCKRKLNRRRLMVFLVGPARTTEAVENLREITLKLFKLLVRQCEVHIGLRIRNLLHIYCSYTRIWGEEMTAKMFAGLRKTLMSRTKFLICSALPLSMIDWHEHCIPDEKLEEAIQQYTTVQDLCSATIHCESCHRRKIIDKQIETIDYCMCNGKLNYTDNSCVYESWEPFIERKNTVVWRKEHDQFKNMYCYKVYGKYDDISANSFAEVQLNTSNRLQWDSTALQLTVEGSDPSSHTDLLYWKVKFPTFFADRDYVFKRRFRVNEERKEIIIVSEAIQHEGHPKLSGIHRVEDYWASMVIRAENDFHQPGMSYTLTYFDNPGTTLPASIINFIASKSFPDFLASVHKAAFQLQKKWDLGQDSYVTLPENLRYKRTITSAIEDTKPISIVDLTGSEPTAGRLKDKLRQFLLNTEFKDNHISFRNAVVDLLEAAEVIGPELNAETFLAKKIQEFVGKHLSEEQSTLAQRMLQLVDKTVEVLQDCAAKKEDSLRVMREIEQHRHYRHFDESGQNLLTKFFKAFNETLQNDKDLKTGKLLTRPNNLPDSNTPQKCAVHKSSLPDTFDSDICPCCAKPIDKYTMSKTNSEYVIEQCPNCYCNVNRSSPYFNISFRIKPWRQSNPVVPKKSSIDEAPTSPNGYVENAWYFNPIFSTWKFILWLLSPWSNSDI